MTAEVRDTIGIGFPVGYLIEDVDSSSEQCVETKDDP